VLFKEAYDMAAEALTNRLLFNTLARLEKYQLGSKVAAHLTQLGTNPKIAFVGVPPTTDGFGVRVAQNCNLVVELFRSVPEGLGWLAKWPAPEKQGNGSP
jgi:hypothetical protein